jgi:hypothetical protein
MNGQLDDGVVNVFGAIVYVLAGVAIIVGAWRNLSTAGRTVLFIVFPIHCLVTAALVDCWPYVSPEGDRKVLWIAAVWIILFLLMIAVCGGG